MSKLHVWIDYLKSSQYVKHIKFYSNEILRHIKAKETDEFVMKELADKLQIEVNNLVTILDEAVTNKDKFHE